MLFLFFKSDDFTGTYVLLSESVDKSLAKYARGVIYTLHISFLFYGNMIQHIVSGKMQAKTRRAEAEM